MYHRGRVVWEVLLTDYFLQWWQQLDAKQQDALAGRIDLLERLGPALGRPAVDTITRSSLSNLKELRAKGSGAELRVLFIFDPIQRAVLLVGGDKSGLWNRWYETAIAEAERVYEVYLASRQYR
ncbi:MAG: type II toxin-antitoxin system RelE/ParE family toxin, partial [Aldersonia sp.]|nr:type II toxin-antitoxin system RelE/ParE family toxin [Aldersonia sp.]